MTTVYFSTHGCSLNISDSEVMQGKLKKLGFKIAEMPEDAEVMVVNTCAVKGPTEDRFFSELKELETHKKPVVVAGCIAKAFPEKLKGYPLLGPDMIGHIAEVIEEAMHENPIQMLDAEKPGSGKGESEGSSKEESKGASKEGLNQGLKEARLNLPKIRKSKIIEIIPICSGCLGSCSYCIVRLARGGLYSYRKDDIIEQARTAVSEGAKEIWLTAQDTGCYGKDTPEGMEKERSLLPELINGVASLPGDFMVRVGMMNPEHAKEMMPELIDAFRMPKVFRFAHIPVQSGSDAILKKMKRKYTSAEFREIVRTLRAGVPDITIATDIICGFPGETEAQFTESAKLVDEIKPDTLNRSRFWARPKTPAAKMKQLDPEVIKSRSRTLQSVFEWTAFERNKLWRGWEGEILIDEEGKEGTNSFVGRNYAYKPVIVLGDYKIGQKIRARVTEIGKHDLRAVEV